MEIGKSIQLMQMNKYNNKYGTLSKLKKRNTVSTHLIKNKLSKIISKMAYICCHLNKICNMKMTTAFDGDL